MSDKMSLSAHELRELNAALEKRLSQCVAQLQGAAINFEQANWEKGEKEKALDEALGELVALKAKLLENEKMAALGEMVAGIAHEINTPVGLSLTGVSHLESVIKRLRISYENGVLDEDEFEDFLQKGEEIARSVNIALERAAELVNSFKQVSVDQTYEEKRYFKLRAYIEGVLLSLRNILKKTNHQIVLECDEHLKIKSYPGAFSQIITNLITNSVLHGYSPDESGLLNIKCRLNDNYLMLEYSDNGRGIQEEHLNKIFEPFFTTKKATGGTGLGMHIVYNIITRQLNGQVDVDSRPGKGMNLSCCVPIEEFQ